MYLRFRTSFVDNYCDNRYGIFQAAHFLLHSDMICPYDKARLEDIWHWFGNDLKVPKVYCNRKDTTQIICWFKPTAREQIQKVFEMTGILEQYGMPVSQVWSIKPGYIVYEDDCQVAVLPFTKTLRNVR